MSHFTPWSALLGGGLIGLAASILLLSIGRVAGVSGIAGGVLRPRRGDVLWRVWFVLGLLAAGALFARLSPESMTASPRSLVLVVIAGLLVGVGTRLGNGCTSGHGVCGISRLSPRSLIATVTFMSTGILMVTLVRILGGTQ
jgi:hypothetical protein